MSDIGNRIRILREEKGMTQQELAEKCGYKSKTSINKIELQRDMPIKKVSIIAKALDVKPEYLMGWQEENVTIENTDFVADMLLFKGRMLEYCKRLSKLDDETKEMVFQIIDKFSENDNKKEQNS